MPDAPRARLLIDPAGEPFANVRDFALSIVAETDRQVEFTQDGVTLVVEPGDTAAELDAAWEQARGRVTTPETKPHLALAQHAADAADPVTEGSGRASFVAAAVLDGHPLDDVARFADVAWPVGR